MSSLTSTPSRYSCLVKPALNETEYSFLVLSNQSGPEYFVIGIVSIASDFMKMSSRRASLEIPNPPQHRLITTFVIIYPSHEWCRILASFLNGSESSHIAS